MEKWQLLSAIIVAIFGSTGFWNWLLQRKASNKEILSEIKRLDGKLNTLEQRIANSERAQEERNTKQARVRLLRFNGELIRRKKHTFEEFHNVIEDIDDYEKYCDAHPGFKNNEAKLSIENIKNQYQKCLDKGTFLPEELKDDDTAN